MCKRATVVLGWALTEGHALCGLTDRKAQAAQLVLLAQGKVSIIRTC